MLQALLFELLCHVKFTDYFIDLLGWRVTFPKINHQIEKKI